MGTNLHHSAKVLRKALVGGRCADLKITVQCRAHDTIEDFTMTEKAHDYSHSLSGMGERHQNNIDNQTRKQ